MARANLAAPETISGERSLGTPTADLQAKARPFSTFDSPRGLVIPEAQTENSLSQLGTALARFNPTLQNLAVTAVAARDTQDAAAGVVAQAKFDAVQMEYADAVRTGQIPAGASPAYHSAFRAKELDSKQLRFTPILHQQYEESGLKNSDDPKAIRAFLAKAEADYRAAALMKDGNDAYTPLEIVNSKFDENIRGQINSLMQQHVQYRTDERTKLGKEIAGQNIGLYIEQNYDATDPNSHVATANAIIESVFGPTGVGRHGVTLREANHIIVDALASKMVELGDESIGNIAKHITTGPGSNVAMLPYAKNKFKEAADAIMTDKIRKSNWNWTERERNANLAAGISPEAEAGRKAEAWKAHDAAQQRQIQENQNKDTVDHNKAQSNSAVSYILKGLELKDMSSPHVKKSFDWLRDNDTQSWMTMTNYANSYKKEKTAFHNTAATDFAAVKLRYDMSKNPMAFNSAEILNMANNQTIAPEKALALLDDWDKAKTHMDNPFLQNPGFTSLVNDIQKVVGKDEIDRGGEAAKNAMIVDHQMRRNAYNWIDNNPKGNYGDFIKAMQEQAEPLALAYSPEAKRDAERKQTKASTPQTTTPKDTRSTMEKVLPNALGGKSKPESVLSVPTGPVPLKLSEAFTYMQTDSQAIVKKMMLDPATDEMDLKAALYNSGLWSTMKSNGRTSTEFQTLVDELIKRRKR